MRCGVSSVSIVTMVIKVVSHSVSIGMVIIGYLFTEGIDPPVIIDSIIFVSSIVCASFLVIVSLSSSVQICKEIVGLHCSIVSI